MLDPRIQKLVWATYRPGQEIDKQPSSEYLLVQRAAVWFIWVAENGDDWSLVPLIGSQDYMIGPGIYAA